MSIVHLTDPNNVNKENLYVADISCNTLSATNINSNNTLFDNIVCNNFELTSATVSGYVLTSDASGVGTWQVSTGGGGDVSGPVSSTDMAVARFNGLTGKIIENSLALLDNSGNLSVSGFKMTSSPTTGYFLHCDDLSGNSSWQPVGITSPVSNLTYYLASTGDNTNDGLSPSTPFATLSYALGKMATTPSNGQCNLNVIDSVNLAECSNYYFDLPSTGIKANPIVIQSNGDTVLVSDSVVSTDFNGTTGMIKITGSTTLSYAYEGAMITFNSGNLSGQQFLIAGASAGSTDFYIPYTLAPDNGSLYDLSKGNGKLVCVGGTSFHSKAPVIFRDIDIILPTFSYPNGAVIFYGGDYYSFSGARIHGTDGNPSQVQFSECTIDAAGYTLDTSTMANEVGTLGLSVYGTFPTNNMDLIFNNCYGGLGSSCLSNCNVVMEGGFMQFQPLMAFETNFALQNASMELQQAYLNNPATDGISLNNSSVRLNIVDVSNATGSGIKAINSKIYSTNQLGSQTSNASYGVEFIANSSITSNFPPDITGVSGNTFLGGSGAQAWATSKSDFASGTPAFCTMYKI
jgi:hypothetical protein